MRDFEIAQLFGVYSQTVKANIRAILKSEIVVPDYTHGGIVIGNSVQPNYHGLDMITTLTFRIQSYKAKAFREYVVSRLHTISKPIPIFIFIQVDKDKQPHSLTNVKTMPRTKELKNNVSELNCYSRLVAELKNNPLLADYDLNTIELKVKHNKPKPVLTKDTGGLINNLLRYQSANSGLIPTLDGIQLINKKLLARMLRVTRITLDSWIKKGFVAPTHIVIEQKNFQVNEVINQLRRQNR